MPGLNLAIQSCKAQTLKRRLGYMHKLSHGHLLQKVNLPINDNGPCVLLHTRCVVSFHMSSWDRGLLALVFLLIVARIVAGILGVRWLGWGPC